MASDELSDRTDRALRAAADNVAHTGLLVRDAQELRARAQTLRSARVSRKRGVKAWRASLPVLGLAPPLTWPNERFLARWPAVTAQPL